MDILIKSYNRPHYLDRCISSIKKYVRGSSEIQVLDDGTPQKYLDKLLQKHPEISLKKSENYARKAALVEQNALHGTPIDSFAIPTHLWKSAVQNASRYFLITEDDVWFTRPLEVTAICQEMEKRGSGLCKLGWLGNKKEETDWATKEKINDSVERMLPNRLLTGSKAFMHAFFNNTYKLQTVLYYLRIVDNTTRLKYWSLNSIMMGIYDKTYWQAMWQGSDDTLNERVQLTHAAAYYHQHKNNRDFILRIPTEAMQTTFQSSATNAYHKYGIDFDVNRLNFLLNEAWLREDFDIWQNFPADFSHAYLASFLSEDEQRKTFSQWAEKFREQYRNIGAEVD